MDTHCLHAKGGTLFHNVADGGLVASRKEHSSYHTASLDSARAHTRVLVTLEKTETEQSQNLLLYSLTLTRVVRGLFLTLIKMLALTSVLRVQVFLWTRARTYTHTPYHPNATAFDGIFFVIESFINSFKLKKTHIPLLSHAYITALREI